MREFSLSNFLAGFSSTNNDSSSLSRIFWNEFLLCLWDAVRVLEIWGKFACTCSPNCTVNFYWRPWPSRLWATRPACQTSVFPSSTMQPACRPMSFLPTYNSIMATFSFFSHFKYITGSKAWGNKQKICIIHHWSSRRFLSFYSPKPRSQVWIFLKYIGIGLS